MTLPVSQHNEGEEKPMLKIFLVLVTLMPDGTSLHYDEMLWSGELADCAIMAAWIHNNNDRNVAWCAEVAII